LLSRFGVEEGLKDPKMPISYHIDHSVGVVFAHGTGGLKSEDIIAHIVTLLKGPAFTPGLSELCDFREVTQFQGYAVDINKIVSTDKEYQASLTGGKLAIVASSDHLFGMMRMYEMLSTSPFEIRIFRDIDKANIWLGLPEKSVDT
jgi:hypothetical protein